MRKAEKSRFFCRSAVVLIKLKQKNTMQMLFYFLGTGVAISLIATLMYISTFKASDNTFPPRRDNFDNVP